MNSDFYGIDLAEEKSFSAINTELEMWDDENGIPWKRGKQFPSKEHQKRADINKTMDLLVSNQLQDVLSRYVNEMPDLSPLQGARVQNIISSLPIFDQTVRSWTSLLLPCFAGIKINGTEDKHVWNAIKPQVELIIRNIFTSCGRVTAVYKNNNKIRTKLFTDKNFVLFRTADDERIITITNVITDGKKSKLECLSYLPDGKVVRDVFEYTGRKQLGEHIVKNEEVHDDRHVIYAKNGSGSSEYGYPELVGTISSSLTVIRAYAALTKSVEQFKEQVRVVPQSSVRKDPATGASIYLNGSTITYDDQNTEAKHDVDFKRPDIDFEGIIKALETSLRQVSIYSGICSVLSGFEPIRTEVSGRTLIASCLPSLMLANGYLEKIEQEIKQIVKEYVYLLLGEENVDVSLIINKPDKIIGNIIGLTLEETEL